MTRTITIGTRGSALARWQTNHIESLLRQAWPDIDVQILLISTKGDRVLDTPLPQIGGKGVFTAELEAALHNREIDLAVHSLKDLPTDSPDGLIVGAIPLRAPAGDALISRSKQTLAELPHNAVIGTSSRRRAAQLNYYRPDIRVFDIRGNVDTRLRKALEPDGFYNAIILAHAGLDRLGLSANISEILALDVMLPAPAQGALGIQCRDDEESCALLAPLNHLATSQAVTAERAFLAGLDGGCSLPVAAYAIVENGQLFVRGRVTSPDGTVQVDVETRGAAESALDLGNHLAQMAIGRGAQGLLRELT